MPEKIVNATPGELLDLYQSGLSLYKISDKFGVTAERIRQILNKTSGYAGRIRKRVIITKEQKIATRIQKDADRFWLLVDKSAGQDACWPYTGSCDRNGYGRSSMRLLGGGGYAHRTAYKLTYGFVPDDKEICHRRNCNNPSCCNPTHLYAGTHQQNMNDREDRYNRGEITRWHGPCLRRIAVVTPAPIAHVETQQERGAGE